MSSSQLPKDEAVDSKVKPTEEANPKSELVIRTNIKAGRHLTRHIPRLS